ncbi:MAG: homoserine kinase [Actinobacteria bacterium]|nr:homoserine kinase [Actinomycetota bacterium]
MSLKSSKKLLTKVRTFATSANLGPGFDCAGLALDIYNDFEVYEGNSKKNCVFFNGQDIQGIAKDENNLICITIRKVLERKFGLNFINYQKPIEVTCKINVPVERGLGSSSTAVVAGLLIANRIYDLNLDILELLNIGLEIEPHPDNIAPCLAGGLVISYKSKNGSYKFEKINIIENFKILLMIPDFKINTNGARKLIPDLIPKEDAILNIANFAILISRLKDGNIENAADFIRDKMHQPYRKDVYPDSLNIVEELNNNFEIPAAISGSGPTAFAFISESRFKDFNEKIMPDLKVKYSDFEFKFTKISNKGSYYF